MEDIKYILPKESIFYKNSGGFIGLKIALELEEKDFKRVALMRSFPLSNSNKYISVRDKDGNEIGIIYDTLEFPQEIQKLFEEELNRRYFLPIIKNINSIKEEFGYTYWEVLTDIGKKRFTIRKDNNSFVNVKDNRIMVSDVDGNRYEISDYKKLDTKSYKLIELLL